MNKKILIMFLSMFMISMSFGALVDNNDVYLSFNDADLSGSNPLDLSGNGYTGSNNGATTGVSGILGESFQYGSGDYVNIGGTNDFQYTSDGTIQYWFNANSIASTTYIGSKRSSSSNRLWSAFTSGSAMNFFLHDTSGNTAANVITGTLNNSQWFHLIATWNSGNLELYLDGNLVANDTYGATLETIGQTSVSGYESGTSAWDGEIDEYSQWSRHLSGSEVSQLYNGGIGFNFYDVITAPIITTNLTNGTYFSNNNISIEVNTSQKANVTYNLDGGSFISLYNNSFNGTLSLTGLSDAQHNLTFNATNINGSSQFYNNFNIDTTLPVITDTLPNEINTYLLNISNYVSCSDSNLKTCNITFTPDSATALVNQTSLYNFTYNGNQSYNIIAEDQAGNIVNESGVILVNPYAYFQFNDSGTLVSNYSFGGILFNGTVANITIYNSILTLGSNTLTFSKLGYITQDFTFDVLNNSRINTTYNVSQAQINVNIYSRVNGSLLTGVSVFVVIEGLASGTTTNGTITFKDALFSPGTYSVTSSATGYFTENKDFIYSSQEEVNISLYMLETSNNFSSTLFVNVVDSFTHFLPSANVKLEEFDTTLQNWKDIGQCLTNSDGQCQFLVEVGSKKYRIFGSKIINGILQEKYSAILGEIFQPEVSNGELVFGNPITRSISLESTPKLQVPIFSELFIEYPYDENETISFVNDSIYLVDFDVSFQATNNIDYTVCLEFYRIEGSNEKFITKNCTTGSSGTVPLFNYELDRDYTNIIKLTAAQGNNYIIVKEYTYVSNDSLFYILNKDNFVPTTILIAWVLLLTISLYTRQVTVFIIGSFFLSILELGFFPSFINLAGTILNIVIGFTLFNIARKKEDNL